MAEHDDPEGGRGFKVADKRRFNPDGSSKAEESAPADAPSAEESAAPQEPPASEVSEAPAAPASESAPADAGGEGPAGPDLAGAEADFGAAAGAPGQPDLNFAGFLSLVGQLALVHMGVLHDPEGEPPPTSLPTARVFIDGLGVLAEKTRGNLTKDEELMLQGLLYELRMAFVERSKQVGE